jgi:hypothetical protein
LALSAIRAAAGSPRAAADTEGGAHGRGGRAEPLGRQLVAHDADAQRDNSRRQALQRPSDHQGRQELQVVYSTLYRRIPTLRLATERDKITFKHDSSVYGVQELPVTW